MKKNIIISTLTTTILLSTLALSPDVLANEYDDAIQDNLNLIEETENNVLNLDGTIQSLKVEVQNTEEELTAITNDITANEDLITEVVERLEKAHKEMKNLQEEIVELEVIIEKRTEQLEKQARKIQVDGQTANYIEFIIDAESLGDILGRIDVVSNLIGSNRKLVEAQVRDKEAVIEKESQTEKTIVQQNALAAELEGISEELEQQSLEKEVLVAQLASERATAEGDRQRFLAEKAEAEKAVVELVVAREEAAQAAREAQERRRAEAAQAEEERQREAEVAEAEAETEVSVSSSESNQTAQTVSTVTVNTAQPTESSSTASNSSIQATVSSSATVQSSPETSKPTPAPAPAPATTSNGVTWGQISSYANSVLGTPYLYGGSTTAAFDCSGFTSYVFRQAGVSLARSAAGQYASSQKVSNPRAGDLVFFSENGSRVSHVGIYVGNGQFIGSQSSTGVAYTSVSSNYWGPRLVGYGRY
ncbi:NlpC/P60 family protein [Alkalibacterium sp. f15]|uniref:C40 family peptidase n=1 Tax=Alkalibacterium sp. f15 TaxID=3414029 RepID=UPI003BF8C3EA